jgi:hypothetical protein
LVAEHIFSICEALESKVGSECSLVLKHLPSICEALGSILRNTHTHTQTHAHTHTEKILNHTILDITASKCKRII